MLIQMKKRKLINPLVWWCCVHIHMPGGRSTMLWGLHGQLLHQLSGLQQTGKVGISEEAMRSPKQLQVGMAYGSGSIGV